MLVSVGSCDLRVKMEVALKSRAAALIITHSEEPFAIHVEQQRGGSIGNMYAVVVGRSHGAELQAQAADSASKDPAKLRVSLGVKCLASGGFDLMDHHYDAAVLRSIHLLDVRRTMTMRTTTMKVFRCCLAKG